MATTQHHPLTGNEFRMPGYTGFIPGVQETYKKTPVMSQLEIKDPSVDSFIHTRTQVAPKGPPAKDPVTHKPQPGVLWPSLQPTAMQPSLKPPPNIMNLGDLRIDVHRTSYSVDYKAPFDHHDRLRSPNRNEDLEKTTADLKDIYISAYNRVGEKRLQKIISTMRERLTAKMGNQNNNAFKFRKLFQMYDKNKTGHVHFEDFRNMAETFGMQLDDDSLLALYYVYDPEGTGYLVYHDLAKHLMDPDCYALYVNDVDVSQAKVDAEAVYVHLGTIQKGFGPVAKDLLDVLQAFDSQKTGYLSKQDLTAGCAGLGLVMSDKELAGLSAFILTDNEGKINYVHFVDLISSKKMPTRK